MELIGKIKVLGEEQTFPSGFNKRAFVITTEEQYPNDIQFELLKDKTSVLNGYQMGERIKVFFDIRGREYQGKYYNNLVAWRVDRAGVENAAPAATPPAGPPPEAFASPADDDLPF